MKIDNKKVWITGATSGIGEAIARQIADKASLLILSGRNMEKLNALQSELSGCKAVIDTIAFDLEDEESVIKAAEKVTENHKGVDILINNGGISQRGMVHETLYEVDKKVMQVNFFSNVLLTKLMLPYMIEQESGHIAATSSFVGMFGFPLRSAYSSSKKAMHGFYETLGLEMHDKGIRTTVVCPGRIKTNISVNAVSGTGEKHGKMDPGQAKGMSAEECARKYIRAIERNQWESYIGKADLLMIWFKRYIPSLFRRIAKNISAT